LTPELGHTGQLIRDEVVDDGEVVHANIGAMDVEDFVKEFKSLIRSNFGLYGLKDYKLQLKMWETSKYGVFDDGVC